MNTDLENLLVMLCTLVGIVLGGALGFYGTLFATYGFDAQMGWTGAGADPGGMGILFVVFTVPLGATLGGFFVYAGTKAYLNP